MGRSASDIFADYGISVETDDGELMHYGKKGMRWGRRKKKDAPDHEDHPQRVDPKKLSDAELKNALARLKMEREFSQLSAPQVSMGRKIVAEILLDVGKQQAKTYLNSVVSAGMTGGGLKGALESARTPVSGSKSKTDKAPEPTPQRQSVKLTPTSQWAPNGKMPSSYR